MKILIEHPPNIQKIRRKFTLRDTTIFTYGNILYNPNNGYISEDLVAHEETHARQQGDDPAAWWKKYLKDPEFRLQQEVEAYRNQYKKFLEKCKDRQKIFLFVRKIAGDLSSSLYGNMVDYYEAVKLIKSREEL